MSYDREHTDWAAVRKKEVESVVSRTGLSEKVAEGLLSARFSTTQIMALAAAFMKK